MRKTFAYSPAVSVSLRESIGNLAERLAGRNLSFHHGDWRMAGFRVTCPSCEEPVRIKDESAIGKKVDCPTCKYRFVVEVPKQTAAAEAGAKKQSAGADTGIRKQSAGAPEVSARRKTKAI